MHLWEEKRIAFSQFILFYFILFAVTTHFLIVDLLKMN